ncbi:MAG: PaaI family thioesterase [Chloroflexota bacterium]
MAHFPKINIDTEKKRNLCFGCGPNNPIGLKLDFRWDGKTATAEFTPNEYYQGWPGIVHGGILACLLDEALGWASLFSGLNSVNARMEVRIKTPVKVGERLTIIGSILEDKKRLAKAKAEVLLNDGTIAAEAQATLYIISRTQAHKKDKG